MRNIFLLYENEWMSDSLTWSELTMTCDTETCAVNSAHRFYFVIYDCRENGIFTMLPLIHKYLKV